MESVPHGMRDFDAKCSKMSHLTQRNLHCLVNRLLRSLSSRGNHRRGVNPGCGDWRHGFLRSINRLSGRLHCEFRGPAQPEFEETRQRLRWFKNRTVVGGNRRTCLPKSAAVSCHLSLSFTAAPAADMDPLLLFQERFAIFELILRQHTSSLNKWAQLLLRRPNLGVQTAVPLVAGGGASGVLQGLRLEAEKHELLRTAKPEKLMAEAARRERCAFMLGQYMCLCVFTICGYSLFSRQKGIKMLKHPGLSSLTLSGPRRLFDMIGAAHCYALLCEQAETSSAKADAIVRASKQLSDIGWTNYGLAAGALPPPLPAPPPPSQRPR